MAKFVPGIKLSKLYYQKEVRPILNKNFPNLKYSAALLGGGSEVLGYDTDISRDHNWGPRVFIFLSKKEYPKLKDKIIKVLANQLPYNFMGYSTNYSKLVLNNPQHSVKITSGPVNHIIRVYTVESFFKTKMGFDPAKKIKIRDWLSFPQQRLLEMTSGEIFFDGLNELKKTREKFSYYPKDVWLYILAAQWGRISQEAAFVGRAGHVGDELGSQIIACRIVRDIMKLCFLMEKKYYPYGKWFGTAFNKLKIYKKLSSILRKVLLSKSWKEREKELSKAYKIIIQAHNSLKITKSFPVKVSKYYGRPYLVVQADKFSGAIRKGIRDKGVKKIKVNIGSVDQFTDSTDVIENPKICQRLGMLHRNH